MAVKVVLCCANGFTTTMLCKKIREEEKQGLKMEVGAWPMTELDSAASDADVILLGPQVGFNLQKVKKAYPDKPVLLIDSRDLAFIDGAAVLEQIKSELDK